MILCFPHIDIYVSIATRICAFIFTSVYLKHQLLFGHLLANVAKLIHKRRILMRGACFKNICN